MTTRTQTVEVLAKRSSTLAGPTAVEPYFNAAGGGPTGRFSFVAIDQGQEWRASGARRVGPDGNPVPGVGHDVVMKDVAGVKVALVPVELDQTVTLATTKDWKFDPTVANALRPTRGVAMPAGRDPS